MSKPKFISGSTAKAFKALEDLRSAPAVYDASFESDLPPFLIENSLGTAALYYMHEHRSLEENAEVAQRLGEATFPAPFTSLVQ